jgi:flavin reductase (DIM6/NTAB) family NADH-FMN oxidoreductase RutF
MKLKKNSWAALFPCPVVLVTCINSNNIPNIITLAWAGIVCSDPPTIGLSIRPHRYSNKLIEVSGELVVNIPSEGILKAVDFCGMVTGKNIDKFSESGLTQEPAEKVKPPLIKECPVNIECLVKNKVPLGVHDLFLSQVVRVHIDQNILNKDDRIDFTKTSPIVYNQGEYWSLHKRIGVHGFSVREGY